MIRVFKTVAEFSQFQNQALLSKSIGFVPTMGALHEGHVSLFRRSQKENNATIASIFVNPTQFNNASDLQHYPRTIEADLDLCERSGVNYVIYPTEQEIYPVGYRHKIIENEFSKILCGQHRPGHFDGVLTVVMKLLNIVKPDRAYFGEKDFQQYQLIKNMVQDFFLNVDVVPCATIREDNGLAKSSRNMRLTPEEKENAAVIYKALKESPSSADARKMIEAAGIKVEYLEEHYGRRFFAGFVREVRLIDNVAI